MHTIDQRILIPTPPDIIWSLISDIARNPDWQEDCRSVSFLTSRREGPGTRWRFTTEKGREAVAEIIAWYQGLGYEYNFIDGMPYRENKGRIRLQEIPEGTVVQWTFSYDLGGPLGGMRNALGTSRQLENAMAASLKTLWREANRLSASERDVIDAKSLIREAPDVEARSQYKPRHASALDEAAEAAHEAGAAAESKVEAAAEVQPEVLPAIVIDADEPPITIEDTQPHPAVDVEAGAGEPPVSEPEAVDQAVTAEAAEPAFLDDLARFEPPIEEHDTQPTKSFEAITDEQIAASPDSAGESAVSSAESEAVVDERTESAEQPEDVPATATAEPEGEPEAEPEADTGAPAELAGEAAVEETAPPSKRSRRRKRKKSKPAAEPEAQAAPEAEPEAAPEPELQPEPVIEPEPEAEPQAEPELAKAVEPAPAAPAAAPERELPPEDTAGKSIWEIFGVPRPAELDDIKPVAAPAAEVSAPSVESAPVEIAVPVSAELPKPAPLEFAPPRFGLRFRLRQSKTRLRRPR
jgi:hypothetical protein